jgi:hypothetical protein
VFGNAHHRGLLAAVIQSLNFGGSVVDQLADLVRHEHLVCETADERELFGARFGPTRRHVHLLIPAQERRRLLQMHHVCQPRFQFF